MYIILAYVHLMKLKTVNMMMTQPQNTVLLQAAFSEIKNPNHSQKTNAHLLFDSGS